MPLVIVESPNKIPKIKKILGADYVVMASVGHIYDLEKKDMGIDMETFTPRYVVNEGKKDVVKNIKAEAKNHDTIYVATDDDREGESIAYNLKEILPEKGKKIERVVFREITKKGVEEGLKNPVGFRENIYNAQQTRRMTDRIVGFKVSPVLWAKAGMAGTSAGRVQSVALKFIVQREKEIRAFTQEEYWEIHCDAGGFSSQLWAVKGKQADIKDKKTADAIVADLLAGDRVLTVSEYDKKKRSRSPAPPFTTASLQKEAGSKFGWTSKRVMDAAQNLFSAGLITYHRTDSERIDPDKVKELRQKIESDYGKQYLSKGVRQYGAKEGAQDAHEAIRPTYESSSSLAPDEKRLLSLIDARFVASQMAEAEFEQASVKLVGVGKKYPYSFKASGSVQTFDGFLKVYGSSKEDNVLPQMTIGQSFTIDGLTPSQHFTKPPARYTDPSLVEKMEKEGVGRPSTYAATIETILDRGFVERDKKTFKATEIGIMCCDYLDAFFPALTSPEFTSQLENEMDKIETGKLEMLNTLTQFRDKLYDDVQNAKAGDVQSLFLSEHKCKDCGESMVKKCGKGSVFLSCSTYPKCGYTVNFGEDGKVIEKEVQTGQACPKCGNLIVLKTGKFGQFYSCSSSKEFCDFKASVGQNGEMIEKKRVETSEHKCPNCSSGRFVKREYKGSFFYGCSGYPNCKTSAKIADDGSPIEVKNQTGSSGKSFPKKSGTSKKSDGQSCPKCKTGVMVEKSGKFGKFMACDNYSNGCKNTQKIS